MRSLAASFRYLVLPFGTITGQRIVLNGVTGTIEIYNAANVLVGTIRPDGDGALVAALAASGARAALISGSAASFVELTPEDWPTHTSVPALISGDISEGTGRGRLILQSPAVDGQDRARLFMNSENAAGTVRPEFAFDSESNDATIILNGLVMPRGPLPQGFASSTGNDVARAAGNATDMTVSPSVGLIGGEKYRVHLHSQYNVGTAAAIYAVVLDYNGTIIGRFDRASAADTPAGSLTLFADGSVVFSAPADDASPTFTVFNDGGSGGTIQMVGTGTNPRTLLVEHIGD